MRALKSMYRSGFVHRHHLTDPRPGLIFFLNFFQAIEHRNTRAIVGTARSVIAEQGSLTAANWKTRPSASSGVATHNAEYV